MFHDTLVPFAERWMIIMDNISNASGLLWIAAIIFFVYILAFILSFVIWCESEKMSSIAYISYVILSFLLCFINMTNILRPHAHSKYFLQNQHVWGLLSSLGILLIISSILIRLKNHKAVSNCMVNIATAIALILFYCILKAN